MAVNERELRITIASVFNGDAFKQAGAAAKNLGETVETTFERMEERAEHTQSVFKGMVEAFIGVEIVEQLKKIAEGANAASDSLEIAANTAKNFGKAFDAGAMETWLQKLAKSAQGGGFAVDQLRSSTQALATTGASAAQIQRLLVDAVALAATKHIELAEATHMVVEAATGHVEMLGRYGIAVKDAAGNTLSFAQVMANLEAETMGNAEKRSEGLEGAFGRLATAANNLVTGPFGQTMEQIFIAGANAVTAMMTAVAQLPEPLLDLAAAGTAVIAGLTALGVMLPATKLAFEFMADGVLMARDMLGLLGNIIMAVVPELAALRDALMSIEAVALVLESPFLAIGLAITAVVGAVIEATRGFKDLKDVWSWFLTTGVGKTLFPKLPELKTPKAGLDGLGGVPPGQQKAIDNWLTAQKEAILHAVEIAAQAVAEAQARLDEATAKLQQLRDQRDPSKPLSAGNVAEEQRLANDEIARERDLRAAVAAQRLAELAAARQLEALAAAVPTNDKDRVQHQTEIRTEADKHVLAAIKLDGTYAKIGGSIAKLGEQMRQITLELMKQADVLARIAAARATADRDLAIGSAAEQARMRYERGTITPDRDRNAGVNTAQYGLDEAQAARDKARGENQDAVDELNRVEHEVAAGMYTFEEGQQKLADANDRLDQTTLAVAKAMDDVSIATKKLKLAKDEEHASTLKAIEDKTIARIPGVSVGQTGNVGFNFGSFLADAISQSHLFANVMQLVNEIMFVFQQIITAVEPIMDSLLTVIAYIVNGFISLWNMIAKLVQILGVHLAQLNYINTVFSTANAQLVTFTHDIPTLNELATGNIAPLTTTPSNNPWSILHSDLVTNDQHQSGWFGKVIEALGAFLLIDWLTGGKFLSGLGSFIPGLGNIFQGVGKDLGNVFTSVGQFFVNGWNGLQNWMNANLGQVGTSIADIAGGTALLFTNDKGVMGWLEKILGVLLIIQGIMNATGGGSIFGAIGNLLGIGGGSSGSGLGTGSLGVGVNGVGNLVTTIGSGVSTGLGSDGFGSIFGSGGVGSGGLGIAGDPTGSLYTLGGSGSNLPSLTDITGGGSSTAGATSGIGSGLGKIGTNIGAGIVGGLLGGLVNGMIGGNSTDSSVGSTVLGAVGSIFGPLGTGVGSFVGAIIGGLFGPHYNQSNNPDMYAGSGYAQGIANWQGGAYTQATGSVSESSSISSSLGGLTEQQFIQDFIQQNPTIANQILGSSMVGLFSGDSSVQTLHQGTLTLGNGQQVQWETFLQDISTAMTTIGSYVQQASPASSGSSTGNSNAQITALLQQLLTGTASTASGASGSPQITNEIQIGTVYGYNDINQLGQDLGNAQIRTLQSRTYAVTRVAQ